MTEPVRLVRLDANKGQKPKGEMGMGASKTRKAAVAGEFYPRDPEELRKMVGRFVDSATTESKADIVCAIVAPHAGYEYSGATAGYAYARIKGKQPERAILLGVSHRYHFEGASIYDLGGFETPLGTFPIDGAFVEKLTGKVGSGAIEPHLLEHSLEVQLPFLAVTVGNVPIVPILLGPEPSEWHARLGEVLADLVGEKDIVIASTDLSHDLRDEQAHKIDNETLNRVLTQDWEELVKGILRGQCSMCGASAVVTAMAFALAAGYGSWWLLDYRTSAKASGDFDRVVGYGAISMERAQ